MRIVVAHNQYRIRGGEDQVFEDELRMLEASGHEVVPFVRSNHDFSGLQTIRVAAGTAWNRTAASDLESVVRSFDADLVHVHNWLPQLSPAVFPAARRAGAAVVQTLHNYRYTCVAGTLSRDGDICEACVGHAVGWAGIKYGCYRNRAATVPVTATIALHRRMRTLERSVDALIVLSEFARSKMIEAGLPAERLHRKPNFVDPDPGVRDGGHDSVLYLGRLVEDKGLWVLVDAWRSMPEGAPTLRIAGSGPIEDGIAAAAASMPNVDYLGFVDHDRVADLVGASMATIVPSLNFEGFPKAIVESFAVGTPVIASDIGSLSELIEPGRTGHLVPPGDPSAIVHILQDPEVAAGLRRMRPSARAEYLEKYTVERNLARLNEIYELAVQRRHRAPN